jgi:glycine cleavage system transcriptional repressor
MTSRRNIQYLAVSVLGADTSGIVNEICKVATHCGCDITESRVTTLGIEFVAGILLTGSWSALAKFEANIPAMEQKHDLKIMVRRTQARAAKTDRLPYNVYLVAIEQSGTVQKIMQFFADEGINLHDIYITTYTAPYSETQMLSISLAITIAKTKMLVDFREALMIFCDDLNYDVVFEPQKS